MLNIIRERKAERQASPTAAAAAASIAEIAETAGIGTKGRRRSDNLLDMLLDGGGETTGDKEGPMTDRQLVDECVTLLLAGHETSSNALAWIMVKLARHPEWQERAREEVKRVVGVDPGNLSMEVLTELPIVTMVVNETLRLYPPVTMISRTTERPINLCGKHIPAGCDICVAISVLHRLPQIWGEDALEFKPERFSSTSVIPAGAFIPFALGPRNCLGQGFALVEIKSTLAVLLQKFSWSLASEYKHHPDVKLTQRPKHGVPMTMTVL